MESKKYKKRIVRNNGKPCGEIISYSSNIKKTLIFGYCAMISIPAFLSKSAIEKTEEVTEKYIDEATYDNIPYIVSAGDTLSDIVYSYASDVNKAKKYIRLIEEYNGIDASHIHSGQTIYLIGIPSSKLEDFGYTDNYNYFGPEVEVELRLEFLDKVINNIIESGKYDDDFISDYRKVNDDYVDYKNDENSEDVYELDYIINTLRDLSESAKRYGFSFENNLKAMPLSDAENYSFERAA